jgi:hypothetical protein
VAYNFTCFYSTLRCSPAMTAGVSKMLWDVAGGLGGAAGDFRTGIT